MFSGKGNLKQHLNIHTKKEEVVFYFPNNFFIHNYVISVFNLFILSHSFSAEKVITPSKQSLFKIYLF